jgi:hypothetical protein
MHYHYYNFFNIILKTTSILYLFFRHHLFSQQNTNPNLPLEIFVAVNKRGVYFINPELKVTMICIICETKHQWVLQFCKIRLQIINYTSISSFKF